MVLEAEHSREHSQEHGQNHARNGKCKREFIDVIAHGNILTRYGHPVFILTVLLRLMRLLLLLVLTPTGLVIVIKYLCGRLHSHHFEGTPIQLEANIFKYFLHRGSFVGAGGQLV